MDALERITLGSHYFKIALVLRESIVLTRILTNAEAQHVEQIEVVDRMLLRKVLDTPISTPIKGIHTILHHRQGNPTRPISNNPYKTPRSH